jgi:type II secretory pathway pseudopilin PulG
MGKRLAVLLVTLIVALTLVGVVPAALDAQAWAFPRSEVLVRQGLLRQALDQVFTMSAPVKVACRGLHRVALTTGGRGFLQIRCSTSLNIKDFIYQLDSRGRIYVTRPS